MMRATRFTLILRLALAMLLMAALVSTGWARQGAPPRSRRAKLLSPENISSKALPAINAADLRAKRNAPRRPGPLQVAEAVDISITLADGTWETLADGGRIWRVRIDSPGALHLNFGFGRFELPEGATLHIISTNHPDVYIGPYTAADNNAAGLWTPMVPGNSAVIELYAPAGAAEPLLEVTRAGSGIIDLFGVEAQPKHQLGDCHIDVVCPEATLDDQERSVARLLINNSGLCTGTLLMDVPGTFTPFLLTANHCGIDKKQIANTVVALFNFEAAFCGSPEPGPMTDTISGSTLLAARADVDGTLLELNQMPPSSFNVFYSGWDRSNTIPSSTAGIHHPQGAVKAYSQDNDPPITTNGCAEIGGDATHWEVVWDLGTTLGGSSGSALFDHDSGKVIGHLTGGAAACDGNLPNGEPDCYGKFAVFWDGNSADERLWDHLDPQDTGTMMVDGMNPPPIPSLACDCNDPNAIRGTKKDDILIGTDGDDIICGFGGNDVLIGGAGNDCLIGGPGKDELHGGPGDDELRGGKGNDLLDGGSDNDVCRGGPGKNRLINCEN